MDAGYSAPVEDFLATANDAQRVGQNNDTAAAILPYLEPQGRTRGSRRVPEASGSAANATRDMLYAVSLYADRLDCVYVDYRQYHGLPSHTLYTPHPYTTAASYFHLHS